MYIYIYICRYAYTCICKYIHTYARKYGHRDIGSLACAEAVCRRRVTTVCQVHQTDGRLHRRVAVRSWHVYSGCCASRSMRAPSYLCSRTFMSGCCIYCP